MEYPTNLTTIQIEQILGKIKNNIILLPTLILLFFCIQAFFDAYSNNWLLEIRNYLAFGSVIINLIVYFQFRRFYKYTLFITLLFGVFNLLVFSADELMASISMFGLKIVFQPNSLLAGIIAYIVKFQKVNHLVHGALKNKTPPEEQEKVDKINFDEDVQKFKERYANYPNDKLEEILTTNKYVQEAHEAAKQLLEDRGKF